MMLTEKVQTPPGRPAELGKKFGPVEAAPGIERSDIAALAGANRSLYAERVKIYPKEAHGRFRTVKWIVMAVTLGIYYLLPWLRWDRGPYLPDQAVLLDLPSRRFYFFFIEIWPQEFYYITGLARARRACAVPRHFARRPRVVRLYLPANGVDRPDDRGRAFLAGRPQRTAAPRQELAVVRDDLAEIGHAYLLAC